MILPNLQVPTVQDIDSIEDSGVTFNSAMTALGFRLASQLHL